MALSSGLLVYQMTEAREQLIDTSTCDKYSHVAVGAKSYNTKSLLLIKINCGPRHIAENKLVSLCTVFLTKH